MYEIFEDWCLFIIDWNSYNEGQIHFEEGERTTQKLKGRSAQHQLQLTKTTCIHWSRHSETV